MKLVAAINNAYKQLKKNNIKSALLDSELLISKAINKKREFVILNLEKDIDKKDYLYFKKLVIERSKGKPIAYLTGKKSFWKYQFYIDKNVLIPRPDTEIIIEQVLKIYKNKDYINFLEIGVGSGCIALSILKEKKSFLGTGVDLSQDCIEISRYNAKKLGVRNRIKLFKSDVDNLIFRKYDLIISNPPYIKKLDISKLDKDVKDYEPKLALDGGLEGLSVIKKVIKKSTELIKINGKLILEIGYDQRETVKKMLIENNFYVNRTVKDLAKNDRCIISTKI